MWSALNKNPSDGRVLKFAIQRHGSPASFGEVLHGWRDHAEFRTFFTTLLSDAPFSAFRWESPCATAAAINQPFEFVLLDSPELERPPDSMAFAEHFQSAGANETVLAFPNLGKDAILVVPRPIGLATAYGHLAAFLRGAPVPQIHALWRSVAIAMEARIGATPVWLSTAGAGVAWLHVRLDDRPKYYGYKPYRKLG
jgi:hypothetical protein